MSTSQRVVTPCGWGVKAGMVRVCWQVKLCDPLVTHGLYLSAIEVQPTTWQSAIQIHATYLLTYLFIPQTSEKNKKCIPNCLSDHSCFAMTLTFDLLTSNLISTSLCPPAPKL